MPTRIRSERFPDLSDTTLFPRLSDQKLDKLASKGRRVTFDEGDELFSQGQRDAPFFVILSGTVDFLDRRPGEEVWFSRMDQGTLIGDIAMFTGEPTIAACVAAEPTEVIEFPREKLRLMVAEWPEFGEVVLGAMMARRSWLEGEGLGVMRLIAPRDSGRAFQVRDLLQRNLVPVRWYDVDSDPDSAAMLETLAIPRAETPVLVRNDGVMRNPSPAQVARSLGLRAEVDGQRFDLVVLGGGPAGLATAVYGGSEGLSTLVVESWAPGGQAGTSNRIENYLGFPTGISGTDLTRKATLQARRFDAVLSSFHSATELVDGPEGTVRVDLDDGQYVEARTVVVCTGATWRSLEADGVEHYNGAGVYHAAMPSDAERCSDEDVMVVGGGNSAGQAAIQLSRRARSVRMVVRGDGLASTMSNYLVRRIEHSRNIEVLPQTEVAAVHGNGRLDAVTLHAKDGDSHERVACGDVFVMIGADPCTEPVRSMLRVDEAGYVLCGKHAAKVSGRLSWPESSRGPQILETVRPGVFAAGDVRSGTTKRVASAVGDGSLAVRCAHEVLNS